MVLERALLHMFNRLRSKTAIPVRFELWNGRRYDFGASPTVTIALSSLSSARYLLAADLSRLGEAFVEGHIRVEGSIHEVFRVAEDFARAAAVSTRARVFRHIPHGIHSDRAAIQYHYDVSNDFYSLFLDRNMVYSCAYFREENPCLDKAQEDKLDHILRKLQLKRGDRILDVGCGWGALILRAARHGAMATGITISRNQYEFTRDRIRAEGLEARCHVEFTDYRDLKEPGCYDKIASVGMFEHVGLKQLPSYFAKLRYLLKDDGLVLNHGITSGDPDSRWVGNGAGKFIDRYVFPNGELPHLSMVLREMNVAGLEVADVESLRRHYARTCHQWATRLESKQDQAAALVGARQLRIWKVYLAGCAYGFAQGWMNLYQILAAKSPLCNPLPLTRDYMYRPD